MAPGSSLVQLADGRTLAYRTYGAADGAPVVFGDATRRPLLERVDVARARLVVVAITDAHATGQVVRMVRSLAPDVRILARTRYIAEADALFEAGASGIVAEEFESTIDLLSQALRGFGLSDESLVVFAEALREEGYEPLRVAPGVKLDPWLAEVLLEGIDSERD